MTHLPSLPPDLLETIRRALAEDIGPGDVTTESIVPPDAVMRGQIIAKQDGVVASLDVAQAVYLEVDAQVDFRPQVEEGARVTRGQVLVLVSGRTRSLLTVIVLTYFCLAIVMFSISSFWKISMHMAGVGGFSTALVFVFGAPALWAFFSLPLVAWARLRRRKHYIPQLIAGALAGTLVTLFFFGWLGKFL